MKFLIFSVFVLAACTTSTQQKLNAAIKDIEQQRFKENDEEIQSLSVKTLSYDDASMQDFYRDESDKQRSVLEVQSDRLQGVTEEDESKRAQLITERAARQLKIYQQLDGLSKTADTTMNLYWVKYRLQAKTSKNKYDTTLEKYLSKNDLKQIKLSPQLSAKEF